MFSKRPQPGSSKTRLQTHLTPLQAAELQAAFVADLSKMLAAQSVCTPYIAYSPDTAEGRRYFGDLSSDSQVFPQEGADLGSRMLAAIRRLAARGHSPVLVIGSDLPTLQPATLAAAVAHLQTADVVLGPSKDGGYWLVGMNQPQPAVFAGITWSTSSVLAQTLLRARADDLGTVLLPPDTDIDTWPDVLQLHGRLQRPPGTWTVTPGRTRALVARLVQAVMSARTVPAAAGSGPVQAAGGDDQGRTDA